MTYLMSRNIRMVQPAVSPAYLHSIESNRLLSGSFEKKGGDPEIPPFHVFGGPCWNRTNNLLIKSQVLCLVELTARFSYRGLVTGLTPVVNGFPEADGAAGYCCQWRSFSFSLRAIRRCFFRSI